MLNKASPDAAPSERYAVIGHPVEHSRSPWIHARFAELTGQRLEYGRLPCPLDGFAATVDAFAAGGARGCNVTVPFKFEAAALAASLTPRAALAQAANTLHLHAHGWHADNTDGAGLVRDIEDHAGIDLRGRRLLLIGAGGAAAGVLGPLLDTGPALLVLANRSPAKAQALVQRHAALAARQGCELRASGLADCGNDFDVVINASAASLTGAAVPVAARVLRRGALALDMMYGPPAQAFLDWAREHGGHGRDGLGMLVEQAAEAFAGWRGVRPPTDGVLAELRGGVGAGDA